MYQGLPDFSQSYIGTNFIAFAPYKESGAVSVIPLSLNIAQNDDGKPDFILESVRGTNPFGSPKPHGILDMRFQIMDLTPEMLQEIRTQWGEYSISVPHFQQGFMRFDVQANRLNPEMKELQEPIVLEGLSISHIRFVRRLTSDTVTLFKDALSAENLLIHSHAELEVKGIAARMPVELSFIPSSLIRAIERLANRDRILPMSKLTEYFKQDLRRLPFSSLKKDETFESDVFAKTMSDCISHHFGTFVPTPANESEPHIRLQTASEAGISRVNWDLSQPKVVSRLFAFQFDAMAEARKLVNEFGIDHFLEESIIESLNTGFVRLMITHPFKVLPKNILSMGVKVNLPYNPPYRPNAINETIDFQPGIDKEFVNLRFTPFEKQAFFYETFVIVKDSSGTRELTGAKTKAEGEHLKLFMHDFPFDIVNISASAGLMSKAIIGGKINWKENSKSLSSSFIFTSDNQQVALALPSGSGSEVVCSVRIAEKNASATIEKDFPLQNSLHLYRYSFPEYGPHTVDVEVSLGNKNLFALELLAEDKEENVDNIQVLSFTQEQNKKSWTWFADSIFQAGFKYRAFSTENGSPNNWSKVQSPFVGTLNINAQGDTSPGSVATSVPQIDGDFDIEGIRCYQDQHNQHHFYYIPLQPSPQSLNNKPSLSLIIFNNKGILQAGAQLGVGRELLDKISQKIGLNYQALNPSLIRMRYAPINIVKVDLVLKLEGKEIVLATSKSSGIPPYGAVFNVNLTSNDTDLVISAMHGEPNILQVEYHATREVNTQIKMTIEGDIQASRDDLDSFASMEARRNWIQEAINSGKLTLEKSDLEFVSSDIWIELEAKAFEASANYVSTFIQSSDGEHSESRLFIEVKHTIKKSIPFIIMTDIGNWLTNYEADEFIRTF